MTIIERFKAWLIERHALAVRRHSGAQSTKGSK